MISGICSLIIQFKPPCSVYVGSISGIILICMTYVHLDLSGFHWFKGSVRNMVEMFYLPYSGELLQLMNAQTPGARSPLQLNAEWWRLKFMNPNYRTCFKSPTWHLEFWSDSWIFGKFVHICFSKSYVCYIPLFYDWQQQVSKQTWKTEHLQYKYMQVYFIVRNVLHILAPPGTGLLFLCLTTFCHKKSRNTMHVVNNRHIVWKYTCDCRPISMFTHDRKSFYHPKTNF